MVAAAKEGVPSQEASQATSDILRNENGLLRWGIKIPKHQPKNYAKCWDLSESVSITSDIGELKISYTAVC